MGGVAVAGLYAVVIVPGREVEDRLAARGADDLADVARDQRAARERAEVDGLEVAEERVVALDRHYRLPRLDLVAVVEGVHDELVPAGLPAAVGARAPTALTEDGDRLVHPAQHRLMPLEDLHQHARVILVELEHLLREHEVRVRVVALAHLLDREVEDLGGQAPARAGERAHAPAPCSSAARSAASARSATSSSASPGSAVASAR